MEQELLSPYDVSDFLSLRVRGGLSLLRDLFEPQNAGEERNISEAGLHGLGIMLEGLLKDVDKAVAALGYPHKENHANEQQNEGVEVAA